MSAKDDQRHVFSRRLTSAGLGIVVNTYHAHRIFSFFLQSRQRRFWSDHFDHVRYIHDIFGIAIGLAHFDSGNLQDGIPTLIVGLKTAFWGSIAGLGGALTLRVRHLLLDKPQDCERRIAGEANTTETVGLLRSIHGSLVSADGVSLAIQLGLMHRDNNLRLDALKEAQLEALSRLSELGSKTLIEALRDVIRDFNNKLADQFGDNFKHLNKAVEQLVAWQDRYKHQVEENTIHLKAAATAMRDAASHYKELLEHASTFTKISKDLSLLLVALQGQRSDLTGSLQQLAQLLTAASGSLPQIEEKITGITAQLADAMRSGQAQLREAIGENVTLMRTSLDNSNKEITKLNTEVSHAVISLIAKTRDQVAVLDAALAEELQKSLEGLGNQLSALSEKFVSDYEPLTEKLQLLVQSSRRFQ